MKIIIKIKSMRSDKSDARATRGEEEFLSFRSSAGKNVKQHYFRLLIVVNKKTPLRENIFQQINYRAKHSLISLFPRSSGIHERR